MSVRGLALLVQLAVSELEAVSEPRSDQEAEPHSTTFVARPNQVAVLVVLEFRRLTGLTGLGAF